MIGISNNMDDVNDFDMKSDELKGSTERHGLKVNSKKT